MRKKFLSNWVLNNDSIFLGDNFTSCLSIYHNNIEVLEWFWMQLNQIAGFRFMHWMKAELPRQLGTIRWTFAPNEQMLKLMHITNSLLPVKIRVTRNFRFIHKTEEKCYSVMESARKIFEYYSYYYLKNKWNDVNFIFQYILASLALVVCTRYLLTSVPVKYTIYSIFLWHLVEGRMLGTVMKLRAGASCLC